MRLREFLKSGNEDAVKKFMSVIDIINEESSDKLVEQLNIRLTKLNRQIKHQQSREAIIKRKIDITNDVLDNAIKNELESEIVEVLKKFKSELTSMLKKIDYKDQDDERQDVFRIKKTIFDRRPSMKKILGIIRNANTA